MAKNKLNLYIFLSLLPVACIVFGVMLIFGSVLFSGEEETTSSGGGCSPSGSVDPNKWDAGFEKAGVFKGKQAVFLSLAEEQGIDPVLFASIAMSETGWGSSNAVTMKNNPGGCATRSHISV
ncbi:glucosaminidase domain-containing protein [Listeria monocytogenes]|nr:glucosaminidase domain-containing protein [Listeria monocytogenes]